MSRNSNGEKSYFKPFFASLFVLFLFPILIFASKGQINWDLKEKYGDTELYTSTDNTDLTLKLSSIEKPLDLQKINAGFIQKLTADKKKALASIGITKWKAEKTEVTKSKGKPLVRASLLGAYTDSSGERVHFIEYHFFRPRQKLQLLLTHSERKKLLRDGKLSNVQQFAMKHGF